MIEANSVQPSEFVTQIMTPDHNVKDKHEKITVQNSRPTKIIRDKLEKNKLKKTI